jgi:hypothetical protein
MNKITICLPSLFLFFTSAYSQSQKSKKDFNKDGVIDQVTITEDGGSVLSTKAIQYFDGKSKKKYEFSMDYSFGSFFAVCNIPNVIGKSGREKLGNLLFGKRDTIESSLKWLIDACSNQIDMGESHLADFVTKYTPIWIAGEPKIPEGYYSILSNSKFEALLKNVEGSPGFDFTKMKSDYFWIDYSPHNHRNKAVKRGEPIDTADFTITKAGANIWIYNTSHGVIVKRQDKYSWIFINDDQIVEANENLRWPSIEDVQMIQDLILVKQSLNVGTNLFIIKPESGFVIRLNKEFLGLYSIEKIEVGSENKSIDISDSSGKKHSLTLAAINEVYQKLF